MSTFDELNEPLDADGTRSSGRSGEESPEPPSRADGPGGCGAGDSGEISCGEAIRVVQEFLDGELDDVSAASVREHFEACRRCYPHLSFEAAYREAICRAVRGETAPPELRAKVSALIAKLDGTA